MKVVIKIGFGVVALLLALTPVLGCAPAAPPSVDVVRVYVIPDITGPYAAVMGHVNYAYKDAQEYINEHGGVKGVPMEIIVEDCGGKVELATTLYMKGIEMKPRPLIVATWISMVGEALHDRWIEDEIVGFNVASPEAIYPYGNTFGMYPLYVDQFGLWVDWLTTDWKKEVGWPKDKPIKVGFCTWDTTYGRAFIYDESYAYARAHGLELIEPVEFYTMKDVDVTTQLTRLKGKGADWIYGSATAMGPVPVIKGVHELGWDVKYGGNIGYDWGSYHQIAPALQEGNTAAISFVGWNQVDNPNKKYDGIRYVSDVFARKKGDGREDVRDKTFCFIGAWSQSLLWQHVISKAVDEVGWENLDSMAVKEQIMKVKNWKDPLGLSEYTYTSLRMSPTKCILYRVEGGKAIPATDWEEVPDLRPAKFR